MKTRSSTRDARVTLYTQEPSSSSSSSEQEEAAEEYEQVAATPKKRRPAHKSPSPSKKSPKKLKSAPVTPVIAPKRWQEALDLITEQRKSLIAPVDSMGCDDAGKLEDDAVAPRLDTDPRSKRFHTLVSLMLSSQTKDPVTHEAMMNLRRSLPGGLTLESLRAATDQQIQQSICKVGFWRRKTEYLRKAADILAAGDGDVPKDIDGLLELPGVGPKMGFLALQSCWNLNVGIGVDTHVHRITNRLRWHKKETTDAEDTRVNLESWLPKELHRTINHTLVGFGQTICLPVAPRCDLCSVSKVSGLCPSKRHVKSSPTKKLPPKEEEEGEQAQVKVELEPAVIGDKVLEGEVRRTDGTEVEKRVIKEEHDGHVDTSARLVW